jgi:hypothetical protein
VTATVFVVGIRIVDLKCRLFKGRAESIPVQLVLASVDARYILYYDRRRPHFRCYLDLSEDGLVPGIFEIACSSAGNP